MHSFDRTMLAKFGFADPDKKDSRHDLACQYVAQPDVANQLAKVVFDREVRRAAYWDQTFEEVKGGSLAAVEEIKEEATGPRKDFGQKNHRLLHARLEGHLQKGEGQYATTVGFIDAMLSYSSDGLRWQHPGEREWNVDDRFATLVSKLGREDLASALRNLRASYPSDREVFSQGGRCYAPLNNCHRWPANLPAASALLENDGRAVTQLLVAQLGLWQFHWHPSTSATRRIMVEVKITMPDGGVGDIIRQLNLYRAYLKEIHATVALCYFPLDAAHVQTLAKEGIIYVRLGAKFEEYLKRRAEESASQPSNAPEI